MRALKMIVGTSLWSDIWHSARLSDQLLTTIVLDT
jgi:hypothetical protein